MTMGIQSLPLQQTYVGLNNTSAQQIPQNAVSFQAQPQTKTYSKTVTHEIINNPQQKPEEKQNISALTVGILLLGGVALGYGHKGYISKGVDAIKNKLSVVMDTPVMKKASNAASDLIAKAKNLIFVK